MMRLLIVATALALTAVTGTAHADTLLIDRANNKPASAIPARGQSMDQVRASFGEPTARLEPRGGQKRQWPTINRWTYPQFVVYFEKSRVIDVVATQARPEEIGPKPPVL
ncbi:hypothetical protein H4O09_06630 [Stenotrophomonas sp. W1S232]|jgi:hypothetical protein|uniref:Lipoprotein SmpA/OmlA domain-containing protein n=1 Tax=Stenotrophomonas koreensis TaxID=266128 RepID=A0A7W3YVB2_9GAMM|nr:hypothetical protein [Stenotrophomonas koreensis]MBB1116733.1 hypothetical protein [Stenotrophomonas koreensis]